MRLRLIGLRAPALAGVFACALLAGCATPQMSRLSERWPADLPAAASLREVPFYPQEDYECGPAALAMVASAAGVPRKPEDLVSQVYVPGRQGSLQPEMLAASRRQGLPAYQIKPELESLLREVAAGHPVVVFQNLSLPAYPIWHYAVVIGYDRERNRLILHSGRTERLEMSLITFERTWERGGHWAMVALAPSQLPATAEADGYAGAVAALERVNPRAAETAYVRALQAWPGQRTLLLGAGNSAYALGERERAVAAYREATVRHPDFAEAWNNLAQVLLDLGRRQEAAEAIARAVALGGPRLPRFLELQKKIAGG